PTLRPTLLDTATSATYSTRAPTRRSSDLALLNIATPATGHCGKATSCSASPSTNEEHSPSCGACNPCGTHVDVWGREEISPSPTDRKSTRLNSSHQIISYAVFCLKTKTAT